jgi:hypothetical protein
MCNEVSRRTDILGTAWVRGDALDVSKATVSFTHPIELPLEHALCIDLGGGSERVTVELDVASAESLAKSILEAIEINRPV